MRGKEPKLVGEMPPGDYYLGDPCYVIDEKKWGAFCDAMDKADNVKPGGGSIGGNNGVIFEFEGHKCFVSSTNCGDGTYKDQLHKEYSVDAGIIGLVPLELCTKRTVDEDFQGLGHRYDSPTTTVRCYVTPGRWLNEGKKIIVGARTIKT